MWPKPQKFNFSYLMVNVLQINSENNLAQYFWARNGFLVKSEVMNFWTYLVTLMIFKWAGVLYFEAWQQNRSGILQGSTKYDYTEVMNMIWQLLENFDQSILQLGCSLFFIFKMNFTNEIVVQKYLNHRQSNDFSTE